jgi:hypothetical protein
MTSKNSNQFPIPEGFPEILHDFAKEVVRYKPEDILDFSIQYFYSLENAIPLNFIPGNSSNIKNEERENLEEINDNNNIKNNEENIILESENNNNLNNDENIVFGQTVMGTEGTDSKNNSRLYSASSISNNSELKRTAHAFIGDILKNGYEEANQNIENI